MSIDFTKPLKTNVPGEVAVALPIKFAGRQLVQITEPNGSQGLYLADDKGHILRLVVGQMDGYVSKPPVLKNATPQVRVPEKFFNIYEDGTCGGQHKSLEAAQDHEQTSRVLRARLGITITINENDEVTVTSRKVE